MKRALPWHRTYNYLVDDECIRLLAFEDRWHFIAIKCLKGQGILDNGDKPDLLRRKVSLKLGVQARELEEIARRLGEVGLINPRTFQPIGWDKEQFVSDRDPTAAERKRRQRAREKSEKEAGGGVTSSIEGRGGKLADTVTDPSRVTSVVTGADVTRIDTEQTSDIEKTTTTCPSIGSSLDWSSLQAFSADERKELVSLISSESSDQYQDLADEVAGAISKGVIKSSWQGWLHGTIKNGFVPNHCREIQAERRRRLAPRQDPLASPETPYERDVKLVQQDFRYGLIDAAELERKQIAIREKYGHSTSYQGAL